MSLHVAFFMLVEVNVVCLTFSKVIDSKTGVVVNVTSKVIEKRMDFISKDILQLT